MFVPCNKPSRLTTTAAARQPLVLLRSALLPAPPPPAPPTLRALTEEVAEEALLGLVRLSARNAPCPALAKLVVVEVSPNEDALRHPRFLGLVPRVEGLRILDLFVHALEDELGVPLLDEREHALERYRSLDLVRSRSDMNLLNSAEMSGASAVRPSEPTPERSSSSCASSRRRQHGRARARCSTRPLLRHTHVAVRRTVGMAVLRFDVAVLVARLRVAMLVCCVGGRLVVAVLGGGRRAGGDGLAHINVELVQLRVHPFDRKERGS